MDWFTNLLTFPLGILSFSIKAALLLLIRYSLEEEAQHVTRCIFVLPFKANLLLTAGFAIPQNCKIG